MYQSTLEQAPSSEVIEAEQVVSEALRWELAREIGRRLLAESGRELIPSNERSLTEIDNINRLRLPDGTHDPRMLAGIKANLVPRVVEPSMPFAVSTTYQEYRDGSYWWTDQTGPQAAASGLRYHVHESARERVVVEISEALELENLLPGRIQALISPRMSRKDASKEVAEAEHLADDDMIRIHWVDADDGGNVRGKFMQSILVRDVPLEAWVKMLAAPDNVFGRSIKVEDPDSALSVMKAFTDLNVASDKLKDGVLDILEDVVRFIPDPTSKQRVLSYIPRFRESQQLMKEVAEDIAERWLRFEVALADSLYYGVAVPEVAQFIEDLSGQWTDEDLATFANHQMGSSGYLMTRGLALRLEEAKQNVLWAQAGVMVENERITEQMDPGVAARIYASVYALHEMIRSGASQIQTSEYEGRTASLSASQNVTVGGGCPGKSSGNFRKDESGSTGKDTPDKEKDNTSEGESSDEVCDYTHTGCYCCPYNSDGTWRSKPVEVRARRYKDGTARCLRSGCGAKLGASGKAISKGGIYARAQALKLQKFKEKQTIY